MEVVKSLLCVAWHVCNLVPRLSPHLCFAEPTIQLCCTCHARPRLGVELCRDLCCELTFGVPLFTVCANRWALGRTRQTRRSTRKILTICSRDRQWESAATTMNTTTRTTSIMWSWRSTRPEAAHRRSRWRASVNFQMDLSWYAYPLHSYRAHPLQCWPIPQSLAGPHFGEQKT